MTDDIRQWVADLNHVEPLRRWQAMVALREGGAAAVPALVVALRHAEVEVRWRAAVLLGWVGDASAIEPLSALLGEGYEVKINAVWALGQVADTAAQPWLLDTLRNAGENEPDIRYVAALALARQHQLTALEDALRSDDLPVYRVAHAALAAAAYLV
ncbi:MAG: HEAT repeat domain-containing protein [Anaerolineaceae bacterium]|nr:HEAT repeat domain-containing protein [Anaerolineaceae bacterium]